jgi:hypothetical protein
MKKYLALAACFSVVSCLVAHENAFNSDFMQERMNKERLSQGRSLDEILKQHGKPLEPGTIIITADGILNDETPNSVVLAKLQHRLAQLALVRDPLITESILPRFKSRGMISALPLVRYIQNVFKQERVPLLAFAAVVVEEQKEVHAIRTESLRLMSDKACRNDCLEIAKKLNGFQVTLLELEQMINALWDELINLLPEDYAQTGE